jgi:hypothetical protein
MRLLWEEGGGRCCHFSFFIFPIRFYADVHHGNGTEDIILTSKEFRDNILFISTHCSEIYPHSGKTSPGLLSIFSNYFPMCIVSFSESAQVIRTEQFSRFQRQILSMFPSSSALMDSFFEQYFGIKNHLRKQNKTNRHCVCVCVLS